MNEHDETSTIADLIEWLDEHVCGGCKPELTYDVDTPDDNRSVVVTFRCDECGAWLQLEKRFTDAQVAEFDRLEETVNLTFGVRRN